MKQEVKIGQTDYTVPVLIRDTAGAPKTGLAYNSAGLDVCYTRVETDNDVVLTDGAPATQTLTGAHSDWGFCEVDATKAPGLYRLDCADGVFATGAWSAVVSIIGTGLDPTHLEFVLVPEAPVDGTKTASMATGAVTATAIAGDAITADKIADNAIAAEHLAANAIDLATFAADVKTGSALKANVETITNGAITAAAIATGAIDADAIADNAIDAGAIAADAITAAKIAANAIDLATFAADCKTGSALKANVETVTTGAITAAAIAADAITEAKIADNALSTEHFAAALYLRLGLVAYGTAQAATGTTLQLAAASAFANDELNGAVVVITGGTGVGQSRVITDYVSSTDTATVDTWTTTPSGTITYVVFAAPPASATALPAVNVTQVGGTAQTAGDLGAGVAAILADTGTDGVVVAAASKTGYTLTATTGLGNQTANLTGNLSGSVGSVTGAVGSVTGAVGSVTGAVGSVTAGVTLATGAVTAAAIATGAIDADALAADAAAEIAVAVRDVNNTTPAASSLGAAVNSAASAGDPWATALPGAYGAGTAGKAVADILADTGTDGVVVAAASKTGYALTATTGLGNQTANITGNLSGSVGSVTGAVGSVTGAVGSVTGAVGSVTGAVASVTAGVTLANDAVSAAALATDALAEIKATTVAALATDTYAEPAAVPAATSTLAAKIAWLFTRDRNKLTQTASATALRNDGDAADIATRTVSDDDTTLTRGEWS